MNEDNIEITQGTDIEEATLPFNDITIPRTKKEVKEKYCKPEKNYQLVDISCFCGNEYRIDITGFRQNTKHRSYCHVCNSPYDYVKNGGNAYGTLTPTDKACQMARAQGRLTTPTNSGIGCGFVVGILFMLLFIGGCVSSCVS